MVSLMDTSHSGSKLRDLSTRAPFKGCGVSFKDPTISGQGGTSVAYQRKSSGEPRSRRAPAKAPEVRELQMISAATDLAEKQILEGTASAAVITHYLKLATGRERLERERLANENELLRAKVENLQSQKRVEVLYSDAIKAFRAYSGQEEVDEFDD